VDRLAYTKSNFIIVLWHDYARCNSLRIFTKFCTLLDVVNSTSVNVRNGNWISDFRGVHIHILAVFGSCQRVFQLSAQNSE